jgi:hypothetical protein
MRDAKTNFRDAAARFDAFLQQAAAEFGSNEFDRAQTERRVDEHLRRKSLREASQPAAKAA